METGMGRMGQDSRKAVAGAVRGCGRALAEGEQCLVAALDFGY